MYKNLLYSKLKEKILGVLQLGFFSELDEDQVDQERSNSAGKRSIQTFFEDAFRFEMIRKAGLKFPALTKVNLDYSSKEVFMPESVSPLLFKAIREEDEDLIREILLFAKHQSIHLPASTYPILLEYARKNYWLTIQLFRLSSPFIFWLNDHMDLSWPKFKLSEPHSSEEYLSYFISLFFLDIDRAFAWIKQAWSGLTPAPKKKILQILKLLDHSSACQEFLENIPCDKQLINDFLELLCRDRDCHFSNEINRLGAELLSKISAGNKIQLEASYELSGMRFPKLSALQILERTDLNYWVSIEPVLFTNQDDYFRRLQIAYCNYLSWATHSSQLRHLLSRKVYTNNNLPIASMIRNLNAVDWNLLMAEELLNNISNPYFVSNLLKNNLSSLTAQNSAMLIPLILSTIVIEEQFGIFKSDDCFYVLKRALDPRQISKVKELRSIVPAYNYRLSELFKELIKTLETRLNLYQLICQ